jgi:hypothetical protein
MLLTTFKTQRWMSCGFVAPLSLADIYRCFTENYCLHHQAKRIFGSKKEKVTGWGWRNEELHILYYLFNTVRMMKSKKIRTDGLCGTQWDMRMLAQNSEGRGNMLCSKVCWLPEQVQWLAVMTTRQWNSRHFFMTGGKFLDHLSDFQLFKEDSAQFS